MKTEHRASAHGTVQRAAKRSHVARGIRPRTPDTEVRFSPKRIATAPTNKTLREYFNIGYGYRREEKATEHANILRKVNPEWAQTLMDGYCARHGGVLKSPPSWYCPGTPVAAAHIPTAVPTIHVREPGPIGAPSNPPPAECSGPLAVAPTPAPSPPSPETPAASSAWLTEYNAAKAGRESAIKELIQTAGHLRIILMRYAGRLSEQERLLAALDHVHDIASFLRSPKTSRQFAENRAVQECLAKEIPVIHNGGYFFGSGVPWPNTLPDSLMLGSDGAVIGKSSDQEVFERLRARMVSIALQITVPPDVGEVHELARKCKELYCVEETEVYYGGAGRPCEDRNLLAVVRDEHAANRIAEQFVHARPPVVNQQELMDETIACLPCDPRTAKAAISWLGAFDWPASPEKWMGEKDWEAFQSCTDLTEESISDAASELGGYGAFIPVLVIIRQGGEQIGGCYWQLAFNGAIGFHYVLAWL